MTPNCGLYKNTKKTSGRNSVYICNAKIVSSNSPENSKAFTNIPFQDHVLFSACIVTFCKSLNYHSETFICMYLETLWEPTSAGSCSNLVQNDMASWVLGEGSDSKTEGAFWVHIAIWWSKCLAFHKNVVSHKDKCFLLGAGKGLLDPDAAIWFG